MCCPSCGAGPDKLDKQKDILDVWFESGSSYAAVLDRGRALGFDAVCTGHYARLVDGPEGRQLHRAADPRRPTSRPCRA